MSDHPVTLVIVGCGSAKRPSALEPGTLTPKTWPAKELYTSTYFKKKREFAETVGNLWVILSAEHGLLHPEEAVEPYNTSIDDLDSDDLEALAGDVGITLIDIIEWERSLGREIDRVVVLAGDRYIDPLRRRDTFSAGVVPRVEFPFQQLDFAGNGEQMAYMNERIDARAHQQTELPLDTGGGR